MAVGHSGYLLVLPHEFQKDTIRLAHSSLFVGHLGVRKTVQRISNEFFYPRMKQKVAQFLRCCHECQVSRGILTKEQQPLQRLCVVEVVGRVLCAA